VLFRQGSQLLHQATFGRFYFKHVTIALPATWPHTSEKKQMTGDRLFPRADVRISGIPHGGRSRPFTLHHRGCGERGEYIQMPAEFLLNMNQTSKAECESP
ncbi:hypothetical protein HPB47_017945, partial [Ixodes persulcatus]